MATTEKKPMYYAVWILPGQKRPGLFVRNDDSEVSWSKIATFKSEAAAERFEQLMQATGGVREWDQMTSANHEPE